MFEAKRIRVLTNNYAESTTSEDNLTLLIEQLCARTDGRASFIHAYVDGSTYANYSIVDGVCAGPSARNSANWKGAVVTEGQLVFYSYVEKKTNSKASTIKTVVPKPAQQATWEVAVEIRAGEFSLVGKRGEQVIGKTVTVERGNSSQQSYLLSAKAALSSLKLGVNKRIVISVGDTNVRKMLQGKMNSKKNTLLLGEVRGLISQFVGVEFA